MTMLCTLIRGQMSYTFFQLGAHVLLCQLLGGQMSSYAIFHRGHMSGNVLHSFVNVFSGHYIRKIVKLQIHDC